MEYKAIVRVTGGMNTSLKIKDEDFIWTGDNAQDVLSWAMNFAEGYTTALMSGEEGIAFCHPYVMLIDGYHWYSRSGLEVKIVNKDGKLVRTYEDL